MILSDTLYLIVPCYNEQEVLNQSAEMLKNKIYELINQAKISKESKILFIDDGSKDKTWDIIQDLHKEDKIFSGIKLSRNRGHQNALLAGLLTAIKICDITISIDADLQDDIDVIDKMLDKYYTGNDIVYGVRSSRESDTFFKRFTAEAFYKFLSLLGVETVFNHADFRLMSSRALCELEKFGEVNLFLRGMVPLLGFKSDTVTYERHKRLAGQSKYPLKKMLELAWQGVTSLSVKPIKLITFIGFCVFFVSMIMILYFLIQFMNHNTVAGWTTIVISVWMLGGLQLISIGLIGEYIGKIYLETKHRPRFIIEKFLGCESETNQK